MTDFIISEEQLDAFEHLMGFKSEMRSRPLSEAIAEHNAGVIKELNQREHNLGMHLTEREKGKCDGYNEAIALIRGVR